MKVSITIGMLFFATVLYGQQCQCETDTQLKEIISCETIHFNNHSKLYRQFNCDSSWLTFESSVGIKRTLYSLEAALMNYTERLGYQYATEYKWSFLIQNNLISGCCTPPELSLIH
ncbi:MAG: hypothetical protein ACQUYJ_19550, partial [Ferruginibacter sp.]